MHRHDRAAAALAARQHGVVTTVQLAACALSHRSIARRIARGWLTPLFRGVYRVGPVAGPRAREMAAILACGDRAVLSHHSAAAVWGFLAEHDGDVHVTIPGHAVRRRPGIKVHRTTRVSSLNAAVAQGLPLTTPARTLHDLAAHLPQHELDRAVEEAQVLKLVTRAELTALDRRHAFERDRRKDAELQTAGYRVVRFTWRQLADEPHAVVARLAQLLA